MISNISGDLTRKLEKLPSFTATFGESQLYYITRVSCNGIVVVLAVVLVQGSCHIWNCRVIKLAGNTPILPKLSSISGINLTCDCWNYICMKWVFLSP